VLATYDWKFTMPFMTFLGNFNGARPAACTALQSSRMSLSRRHGMCFLGIGKMMKSTFKKFHWRNQRDCGDRDRLHPAFMLLLYFGLFDMTVPRFVNRKVTYPQRIVADLVAQNKTSVLKSKLTDYYKRREFGHGANLIRCVRIEVLAIA
jgi:hypothetical protein